MVLLGLCRLALAHPVCLCLRCSSPPALETSSFKPLHYCSACSPPARLCPMPCRCPASTLHLSPLPIACAPFCLPHLSAPRLPLPPPSLCWSLQFGFLTFCWVLFSLASALWGFRSHQLTSAAASRWKLLGVPHTGSLVPLLSHRTLLWSGATSSSRAVTDRRHLHPGRDHPDPPPRPLCIHDLMGVPQV